MMTQIVRRMFTLALVSLAALTMTLALAAQSDTGRIEAAPVVAPQDVQLVAASTPKRHIAMRYNYAQRGDKYVYGATGPSTWDCSGIVMKSYAKAGIKLPRTTYSMIKSSKLVRTSHPRWGDIVFTSSGHVEMYVQKGWMHGAHHSGTRVGYKRIYKSGAGWPRYYRVRGAG